MDDIRPSLTNFISGGTFKKCQTVDAPQLQKFSIVVAAPKRIEV